MQSGATGRARASSFGWATFAPAPHARVTKIGEICRSKYRQKLLAAADARPLHEEAHEIGEPLDAGLVEDVADVGARRVLGHREFVGGFARREL